NASSPLRLPVVRASSPSSMLPVGENRAQPPFPTLRSSHLTFTPANWNVAQTVTVTGVDDALLDGPIAYTIVTAPAVSTDPNYNGLDTVDVAVTNIDNDQAGITVNPTSGLETTEAGGTATFSVVLNNQPGANVTIGLSS